MFLFGDDAHGQKKRGNTRVQHVVVDEILAPRDRAIEIEAKVKQVPIFTTKRDICAHNLNLPSS